MSERKARKLNVLPLGDVEFTGGFWGSRIHTNRQVTLPIAFKRCKESGRLDAFRLDWKPGKPNEPHKFWDSDVGKWVEAAAYDLAVNPDAVRREQLDAVAALVASAQQKDGYLNVHYSLVEPELRWKNVRDNHELYCAGHLMEGAVAHFQATGSKILLDAMSRYADHIASVFGRGKGQVRGYCGHEEIELALVKLYRATGKRKYLELASYFIDERGRQPHFFDKQARDLGEKPWKDTPHCWQSLQAHKPVREQKEVVGHAVRAMYLYCGMVDVAMEKGDAGLMAVCRNLWDNVVQQKLYITGGIGSRNAGEAMGPNYDLPNDTAYAETCASIGLVFFAQRMLLAHADAQYADVMETALYNGIMSGVSLSGDTFFYSNPLAVNGRYKPEGRRHEDVRQKWFECSCCPTNIIRLLASLGEYAYAASNGALFVNLYAGGTAAVELAGQKITLTQKTDYPWEGRVTFSVGLARPGRFKLMLRIPGWCRRYTIMMNGKACKVPVTKGYAAIAREWVDGDKVVLLLDMAIERVAANPAVVEDAGKVALQRGPLVYCLEQCDQKAALASIALLDKARLVPKWDARLLGGCVVIEGEGLAVVPTGWQSKLYRPAREVATRRVRVKAVPYSLWNNRGAGAMTVWIPKL